MGGHEHICCTAKKSLQLCYMPYMGILLKASFHRVRFVWQPFNATIQLWEKGPIVAKEYTELEQKQNLKTVLFSY